jgi:hypothetical protein
MAEGTNSICNTSVPGKDLVNILYLKSTMLVKKNITLLASQAELEREGEKREREIKHRI